MKVNVIQGVRPRLGRGIASWFAVMASTLICAQTPQLKTTIDTATIRIGEQITVRFEVKHDPKVELYWPEMHETFGMFELVDAGAIETTSSGNQTLESRNIIITAFDSGYQVLEPFTFRYRLPNSDTLIPLESEAFMIRVNTVEVDTSQPIRPIVGPYTEKRTFTEMLPYFAIPLMIIVLAVALWLLWRSRKKKAALIETIITPDVPPHEWALQKLKELDEKKLWQQDLVKQHYVELTEILRIYIEKQLHVPAVEQTSDEIIRSLHGKAESGVLSQLKSLLQLADLVKFAKAHPLPDEHTRMMGIAVDFVKTTGQPMVESVSPLTTNH